MSWETYYQTLEEFISYKSVSTDAQFAPEMTATVSFLDKYFTERGFTVNQFHGPNTYPVVFAETPKQEGKESILVYGHYDVQPADPDGWHADPFTLHEHAGTLYARGVADNKGQVLVHIDTVCELLHTGNLAYNVKFLIEGNEESGNADLGQIIADNLELIKSDYVLISDGQTIGEVPTIETGLRGGFNIRVIYQTAPSNLHSGLYGGVAPNATHELVRFAEMLFDADGRCLVPGFYDDVDPISEEVRANNQRLLKAMGDINQLLGVKATCCLPENDPLTQIGLMPTLQITGFKSGYIEEGFSNIVPCQAELRLNIRTVASQDTGQMIERLKSFIEDKTVDYVDCTYEIEGFGNAIKLNKDRAMVRHIKNQLELSFGTEAGFAYCGGGIPVVAQFQAALGTDPILVSLANHDCNMHGVNENFAIAQLKKAISFSQVFWSNPLKT